MSTGDTTTTLGIQKVGDRSSGLGKGEEDSKQGSELEHSARRQFTARVGHSTR